MKKSATASLPAPITTTPGGPSQGASITPTTYGTTTNPIVIKPPAGGPGIVIPQGGPTVDYPAPLDNGPTVSPGQVQNNDPGYYLTGGGSGTYGQGQTTSDKPIPILTVDQTQLV